MSGLDLILIRVQIGTVILDGTSEGRNRTGPMLRDGPWARCIPEIRLELRAVRSGSEPAETFA